jgi:hypothetical protein
MAAQARSASGPVVRRLVDDSSSRGAATGQSGAPDDTEPSGVDDGELFERIVDALEQRVLDELERRGYRNTPGVY